MGVGRKMLTLWCMVYAIQIEASSPMSSQQLINKRNNEFDEKENNDPNGTINHEKNLLLMQNIGYPIHKKAESESTITSQSVSNESNRGVTQSSLCKYPKP